MVVSLVCPSCKTEIVPVGADWKCPSCGRAFTQNRGILSFLTPEEQAEDLYTVLTRDFHASYAIIIKYATPKVYETMRADPRCRC